MSKIRSLNKSVILLVEKAFISVAVAQGIKEASAKKFYREIVLGRHTDNPLTAQGRLFKTPFTEEQLKERCFTLIDDLAERLAGDDILSTDASLKISDVIVIEAFYHIQKIRQSPRRLVHLLSS